MENTIVNITDKAIDWMDKRDESKPFCLMVHHKAPHVPYIYPKKYEKLYAKKKLPLPENFNADFADRGEALATSEGKWSKLINLKDNHFDKIDSLDEDIKTGTKKYKNWAYQNVFKGYLRLVAALDDNIGRLLDHLQNKEPFEQIARQSPNDFSF